MKKNGLILLASLAAGWLFFPAVGFAATLFINPGSGSFPVGSTFSVSVRTNTQGSAINSAEATVSYSSDTLELIRVGAGSTFPLQSPGSPSQNQGTAFFSGGIPTPGYNGNAGIVGTLTFRAKAEGAARVSINSGKVLLNDGLGTNALSGSSGASFTITPPPVGGPAVVSATHPSSESWYATSTLELSWNRPSNAYGFSFDLDQDPGTTPDNTLDTTVTTSKSYDKIQDGVWYFHIKARGQSSGFGAVTHYKIQIDTEAPEPFELELVGQGNLNDVTRTPTVNFAALDSGSGIKKYDIFLDGEIVKSEAVSPYTFEKLEAGPHLIRVVAFDQAGNFQKVELPVIVTGPQTVTPQFSELFKSNVQLPIYILVLTNLATVAFLVYILMRRRKKEQDAQDPVAAIQQQIDASLEDLKLHINKELTKFSRAAASGVYQRQEQVSEQVGQSIGKAKRKIDKEIGQLKKIRPKK